MSMSATSVPPFPDDVQTHPLLVVDYQLVKQGDKAEVDKLWDAATKLGFWYLKNHGADNEVNAMFNMDEETMKLPLAEKMKYEQGDGGSNFGYKAAGASAIDESGTLDSVEFINVAKDDALAYPNMVHRDYPESVNARMESAVQLFTRRAIDVCATLLGALNDRLGLPTGALGALHRADRESFCQSRCTRSPPVLSGASTPSIGQHTDYGSLSFLHNRLGGLQVLPPGASSWYYIKPLAGHAICNVGDALAIMSGGILRSNMHRVVAPPQAQAAHTRWSLVYFYRPNNGVVLEALAADSAMIAGAVAASADPDKYSTGETADAWLMRRVRMRRTKNMTGPEAWRQSLGTEHDAAHSAGAAAREVPVY